MNTNEFIAQIKTLANRYKEWWFKPFATFRAEYSKEHPNFYREPDGMKNYSEAYEKFVSNLRNQSDVIGEIYDFLDQNYEVYLNATAQECEDIRKIISNSYYSDSSANVTHFLEDLFMRYVKERIIPKIKETADKVWLARGLVAMSIEDCGIDYRDSILTLSELRKAAIEKNIDPQPEFSRVAQISSNETPRGGSTPMKQLMEK